MAVDAAAVRAGMAYVELFSKDSTGKGLAAISNRFKSWGRGIAAVGAGLFATAAAWYAPLVTAAKSFAATGADFDKVARTTGISAEAVSELAFAAGDVDTLAVAVRFLSNTLDSAAQGGKAASESLGRLGLTAAGLMAMNPEDRFKTVARALEQVGDAGTRSALAMDVFGRGGRELLPALSRGAGGMDKLIAKGKELGLTMSGEQVEAAKALKLAYKDVDGGLRGIALTIGGEAAPLLTELLQWFGRGVKTAAAFVQENKGLVRVVALGAAGVAALGASIVGLGLALTVVGAALGSWKVLLGAIAYAYLSPGALLYQGIKFLGIYLLQSTSTGGRALAFLKERFGELAGTAVSVWGTIKDSMVAGDLTSAWDVALNAMNVAWLQFTQELRPMWIDFVAFVKTQWGEFQDDFKLTMVFLGSAFDSFINSPSVKKLSALLDKIHSRTPGGMAQNLLAEAGGGGGGAGGGEPSAPGFWDRAAAGFMSTLKDKWYLAIPGPHGLLYDYFRKDVEDAAGQGMEDAVKAKGDLETDRIRREALIEWERLDRQAADARKLAQAKEELRRAQEEAEWYAAAYAQQEAELAYEREWAIKNAALGALTGATGKVDVMGTFSAAALERIGFGGSIQEKQLEALNDMREDLRGIRREGAAAFGG